MSEISKVSFKFPTVKCAELAVKMKNDNARKQQFFQAVAEAYLVDDELFNKIIYSRMKRRQIKDFMLLQEIGSGMSSRVYCCKQISTN